MPFISNINGWTPLRIFSLRPNVTLITSLSFLSIIFPFPHTRIITYGGQATFNALLSNLRSLKKV